MSELNNIKYMYSTSGFANAYISFTYR